MIHASTASRARSINSMVFKRMLCSMVGSWGDGFPTVGANKKAFKGLKGFSGVVRFPHFPFCTLPESASLPASLLTKKTSGLGNVLREEGVDRGEG